MKTAFFPFTHLPRSTLMVLEALFGTITLYQPLSDTVPEALKKWEADHHLHLCCPASGNERELRLMLNEYRWWMESHSLPPIESLRFQEAQASASDDSCTFRIRDEIRHRLRVKENQPANDTLLAARLFLSLAQEYDSRQTEIADEFTKLHQTESRLFDALRGDGPTGDTEEGRKAIDTGETAFVLIPERIRAWSRLLLEDDPLPDMYVTTSREAFEIIADHAPAMDLLPGFDAASFPLQPTENNTEASRRLMSYLKRVAASEWPAENADIFNILENRSNHRTQKLRRIPEIRLTLAIAPDTHAGTIFSGYSGHPSLISKKSQSNRHTLLALAEW